MSKRPLHALRASLAKKVRTSLRAALRPLGDRGRPAAQLGKGDFVICLGAGQHQVPVIRSAQRLGFRVIAIDRNPQAPGLAEADLSLVCSVTRTRAIVAHLAEWAVSPLELRAVVARSFGRVAVAAAVLSARLGLAHTPIMTLRAFADKRGFKERAGQAGVSIPGALAWGNLRERWRLQEGKDLPLIVRPSSGHGKLGVSLLKTPAALQRFLKAQPVDDGSLLMEPVLTGLEVVALGVVVQGNYRPLLLSDRGTSQTDPLFAEHTHSFPSAAEAQAARLITEQMQKLANLAGYQNGPLVGEFIISQHDGLPYLIEAAPEVGGEYLADIVAPLGARIDYFDTLIRVLTGVGPAPEPEPAEEQRAVVVRYLLPENGRLASIFVPEELKKHAELVYYRQLRPTGHSCSVRRGNLDRPFVFALSAPLGERSRIQAEADRLAKEIHIEYQPTRARLGKTLRQDKGQALLS